MVPDGGMAAAGLYMQKRLGTPACADICHELRLPLGHGSQMQGGASKETTQVVDGDECMHVG